MHDMYLKQRNGGSNIMKRLGEASRSWFRCERFYHTADGWWFQTREHTELGPFESQHDAEAEVCLYVRKINLIQNNMSQQNIF